MRFVFALFVLPTLSACSSCARPTSETIDLDVKLTARGLPGEETTLATLTLRDRAHRPVRGARLKIQGFMAHPGMTPLITTATEQGDGVYLSHLRFTMAGDWALIVTGELPDGQRISSNLKCQVSSLEDQLVVGPCT